MVRLNLIARRSRPAQFTPGEATQEAKFTLPATGKFFCLESLNAQDGKPYAAVAELDLLDANGNAISHNGWTIAYVDSEERAGEDGSAENAIDGQTANFWHTQWSDAQPDHPHFLISNLGQSQVISASATSRVRPREAAASRIIRFISETHWSKIRDSPLTAC